MVVNRSEVADLPADVHEAAFSEVIDRIAAAPIESEPFPHIYVKNMFPSAYYNSLLRRIEAVGQFAPATYPGVGVDLKAANFRDFGLTCENFDSVSGLGALYSFLKSERFAWALLNKFSAPNSWPERGPAIPLEKHTYFSDGRKDFATVFDLHKDMAGYEISPHPDVPSKLVTFLFYLTPDDSLREFGTLLCKLKTDAAPTRSPKKLRSKLSRALLKQTASVTGPYGLGQRERWLPWEEFDIATVAEAQPNSFLAFAPNDKSYHAVRMNIPSDAPVQERLTLRGFIRSSQDSRNWKAEYTNTFGRRVSFRIARLLGLS